MSVVSNALFLTKKKWLQRITQRRIKLLMVCPLLNLLIKCSNPGRGDNPSLNQTKLITRLLLWRRAELFALRVLVLKKTRLAN